MKMSIDLLSFAGITPQLARRIEKQWPDSKRLAEMLHEHRYDLLGVSGMGFAQADRIALQLGMKPDSTDRRRAVTVHVVKEAQSEGHTCLPLDKLALRVKKYVALEPELHQRDLVIDGEFVSYAANHRAERYIALRLFEMAQPAAWTHPIITNGLAPDQAQALKLILHQKLFVLLGMAGTGKTTLLKTLLDNLDDAKESYSVATPTGKASKRCDQLTGREAKTIHLLLVAEYDEDSGRILFRRNEANPLDADWIILDETSMVDVQLMQSLLRAIPPTSRLLLVGDPWQLPSVGAGDVLRDMTADHGLIPYATLQSLKRQDPAHLLAANCGRVRRGQMVEVANNRSEDFFFVELGSGADIAREVVRLVADQLPAKWDVAPDDIQVITARRQEGDISCSALNCALRARLNPGAAHFHATRALTNCPFAPGDRVIQLRNNYRLGVMNGEVGSVVEICDHKEVKVWFDSISEMVEIPPERVELDFAWALTVHKFQGSQAPWVVLPIHSSAGAMVPRRRWLYTALSRGVHCVVVGDSAEFE